MNSQQLENSRLSPEQVDAQLEKVMNGRAEALKNLSPEEQRVLEARISKIENR